MTPPLLNLWQYPWNLSSPPKFESFKARDYEKFLRLLAWPTYIKIKSLKIFSPNFTPIVIGHVGWDVNKMLIEKRKITLADLIWFQPLLEWKLTIMNFKRWLLFLFFFRLFLSENLNSEESGYFIHKSW